jgi:hypothetical protein
MNNEDQGSILETTLPYISSGVIDAPYSPELAQVSDQYSELVIYNQNRFLGRVANTVISPLREWWENPNKVIRAASGLGVLATQAVGAAKLPSVGIPIIATDVLTRTDNPGAVGLTAAAISGAWTYIGSRSLSNGINQFPDSMKTLEENFPSFSKHLSDSLAGLEVSEDQTVIASRKASSARRIGNQILTHAKRGITAYTFGIVPYMMGASIKHQSSSERKKLSALLSLDSATMVGLISASSAEVIIDIGHKHPELARQIQHDSSNVKFWYGVAAVIVAGELLNKRLKNRKTSD